MNESVKFSWNKAEFDMLLETCKSDEAVRLSLLYLDDKSLSILEAGCGSGRVVKFLYEMGYKNVCGIELNVDAVADINEKCPKLKVIAGDILDMPFQEDSFDRILSYGVVEHFPKGLEAPLQALYRALKPGGIAVVTVPCLNRIRQVQSSVSSICNLLDPRKSTLVRNLFNKQPLAQIDFSNYRHNVFFSNGEFFEYRLTPVQFETACKDAGFDIVESIPISHIDGLFHLFGPALVRFENWKFYVSRMGTIINSFLKWFPFMHNHMHACVLTKGR